MRLGRLTILGMAILTIGVAAAFASSVARATEDHPLALAAGNHATNRRTDIGSVEPKPPRVTPLRGTTPFQFVDCLRSLALPSPSTFPKRDFWPRA